MAKIRFDINHAGVAELLNHPALVADIEARCARIAAAAGEGFKYEAKAGRDRAIGVVWSYTNQAKAAEARDRALTRAIDAGR